MKRILIGIVLLVSFYNFSKAEKVKSQYNTTTSNSQKQNDINELTEISKLVDQGKLDEAKLKIDKILKKDSSNFNVIFENALLHLKLKRMDKSIEMFDNIIKNSKDDNLTVKSIQLLSNCYIKDNDVSKAEGLVKSYLLQYPKRGELYYQLGIICLDKNRKFDGIDYLEKSIEKDPSYINSYFELAKTYLGTGENLWALIYAEIFINLSNNNEKSKEASKIIYNVYNASVDKVQGKNKFDFQAGKNTNEFEKAVNAVYNQSNKQILEKYNGKFTLEQLIEIRKNFANDWAVSQHITKFKNPLFNFQKNIIDNNFFEIYNATILMEQTKDESLTIIATQKSKLKDFGKWMVGNSLKISETDNISRNIFEKK